MSRSRIVLGAVASISTMIAVASASAGESMVTVTLAGETYEAPPEFEVRFADKVIGNGKLTNALDTASQGRLKGQDDWAEFTQSFSFAVPDDVFNPKGDAKFRLTNNAWGGPDTNLYRNLYLVSATVNGVELKPQDFELWLKGEKQTIEPDAKFVPLEQNSSFAVASPPSGTWPAPESEGSVSASSKDAVQTASAPQTCSVTKTVNVTNFGINGTAVPGGGNLNELAEQIGNQACGITITGYASLSGSKEVNLVMSDERAKAVAAYLEKAGVDVSKMTTVAGGATSRFGSEYSSNRRVVVSVAP